ncbi:restriction endonuclease [Rhizobium ruizarguesonis]|uniref:restriction endonuclease n=1 Tax=Rhizobium ruizarguesonis TaxID=2081791 RepID=UPI00102F8107|nr:restriction endonuclease [Rhizobium ruizarguesonis]TAY79704.1 restriction endonuclease [Rhizobium ruizarguesonis]TBD21815.1 restriction endonuclease [Rhizobium ruizarguesonis]
MIDKNSNHWVYGTSDEGWRSSGNVGFSNLAHIHLDVDNTKNQLLATVEFGDAEIELGELSFRASLFGATLITYPLDMNWDDGLTPQARSFAENETPDKANFTRIRPKGRDRMLFGRLLNREVVGLLDWPGEIGGRRGANVVLGVETTDFIIEDLRSSSLDLSRIKRTVIEQFFNKRLFTNSYNFVTLAHLTFESGKSRKLDLPDLVMKTIVQTDNIRDRGFSISAVTIPWYAIARTLHTNPAAAYEIPADKWEEIIAGAYLQSGYDEVILTPRSRDYGRDVIATKKGFGSVRVIDQVKAYKPTLLVDQGAVREMMGVLQGDPASKGFITTTSDFAPGIETDPLIKPFLWNRLSLVNGPTLFRQLSDLSAKEIS